MSGLFVDWADALVRSVSTRARDCRARVTCMSGALSRAMRGCAFPSLQVDRGGNHETFLFGAALPASEIQIAPV